MGCKFSKNVSSRFNVYEIGSEIYTYRNHVNVNKIRDRQQQSNSEISINDNIIENLDKNDFIYKDLISEIKIKLPQTVDGQQFIIENCKDTTIVICDICETVTIDDCYNCKIVFGPIISSVFVRDCTNCEIAILCQQFRCRDSEECKFYLHCKTRPTIESSKKLYFCCYDFYYTGLSDHMKRARLSYFKNYWFDIYDYTPNDGNWHYFKSNKSYLRKIVAQSIAHKIENDNSIMFPSINGYNEDNNNATINELMKLFILFNNNIPESKIIINLSEYFNHDKIKLNYSNKIELTKNDSFSEKLKNEILLENERATDDFISNEIIILEFLISEDYDIENIKAKVKEINGYIIFNNATILNTCKKTIF